jgi:RNA polymerase sigma factor for flagellar operon FliA
MTPPPPPPAGQRPGLADAAEELAMHWSRWQRRRSQASRDHLIVHYSPLVKFVAGRVGAGLPRSVDGADLVGHGVFGLIDALDRFEADRGVKFETFAAARIRGAIYDGLRQLDWVPRRVRAQTRRIEQAIAAFEHAEGRSPSDAELAGRLGISEDDLARWLAQAAATTVGPLDRAISAGLEPEATGEASAAPGAVLEEGELRRVVRAAVRDLPEREKLVLSLYYDEGLTLAEIGEVLGVTESRVSQIHTRAVLQLRSRLRAADLL